MHFYSNRQKLNELHTEYENVAQLRLDQLNAIQTQWQFYQEDTKPSRKKEILKRQTDFEKDLELAQKESNSIVNQQAICRQLIDILKAQDRIQILNQSDRSDSTVDFSVVIIPHDILELFWSIGVKNVPATKSDIPSTILYLEDMLKKT
ncbi:hypothetical protein EDC96DRAFT_441412 [Choanephora cucurbitarum]|nr:hypothetical protein EDC96DRAFT_441412 [Choanephora cucurbitarum]